MYFLESSLSLLRCLFCVMGKRPSTIGSVMVAPEHHRFCDRMSRPSLGDIRNMQPPLPTAFTAASRRLGWHYYRQFPSMPKSPTRIYEVSLKFAFPRPLFELTKTASPPCLPPPQCYYSPSPLLTTDNLVLHVAAPVRLIARTDPPVTTMVLTAVPARAHCYKIQTQG